MDRKFAVAALATAGAIGLAVALQALTDGSKSAMQVRRHAEDAGHPHIGPGTAADEDSQLGAESPTNFERKRTTDGDAGWPAHIESAPDQQASNDGRERLADARRRDTASSSHDAAAMRVRESSLSSAEVHDFFVEGDACLVLGETANRNARCRRAEALAGQIVSDPKTSEDSWAYGMEYELDRRLAELVESNDEPALLKRKAVRCTVAGCLVYVEGSGGWSPKLLRLAVQTRGDAAIAQLNDNGKWPREDLWSHWVDDRTMMVLPR
jgi:hypothetical protein